MVARRMPLSPYVASMRARIGHDLLLLPSVTVLPVDDDGRLLLVRRIVGGVARPDGEEVIEVGWFSRSELATLPLNELARALLGEVGWLD